MEHRRGNDPLPFALALEQEEARCREALPLQHRVFSYVDRGFYSAQLRRLWRFFGKEQVLVLRQEELRLSPQICLDKIWQHLSIPPGPAITPLTRHNGEYRPRDGPTLPGTSAPDLLAGDRPAGTLAWLGLQRLAEELRQ